MNFTHFKGKYFINKHLNLYLLIIVSLFTLNLSAHKTNKKTNRELTIPENKDVIKIVNRAAKWQLEHYDTMNKTRKFVQSSDLEWANGVFWSAVANWGEFTNDTLFVNAYKNVARRNYFSTNNTKSIYHADDIAVTMMYLTMYDKERKGHILAHSRARMDYIINYPATTKLIFSSPSATDRWSWCDALYMAPPAFTAMSKYTGDMKYIDFMDNEFRATYQFLYSPTDSLFFRDSHYFGKKENNGKNVFWGRGNGWVVAGLCQILENMPNSYRNRYFYENLLKEMLTRLAKLQSTDGYWHASLLDANSYPNPEASASAFILYAYWWAINNNILNKDEYLEFAVKGWKSIEKLIHPQGYLGWVQPIGENPQNVTKDMTEVYGNGALILLGKEIVKYNLKKN